ncbi:hypothetical protein MKZ38_001335 [Zalerion maritima]|uniref:Protein kinase domain-containing protein n=1 Tax=Zalerion maritima TaxID=339359 RepID=A0AAD5RRG1_9PEZI|nr:hypothetical protein MKZ38_001335 [Zalerion maritima]
MDLEAEIERLKRQIEDGQQRAEEAERQQQRDRERFEEAQQRIEEAERQTRKANLHEYIEACHEPLFKRFAQKPVFGRLLSVYPGQSRDFESLSFLRGLGERVAGKRLANEKDLEYLQHSTVEDPVRLVVGCLAAEAEIQNEFRIGNGIVFENHPNALSDVADEPTERRAALAAITPGGYGTDLNQRRPDQICVYKSNKDDRNLRSMAFIVEYKPPHKLTQEHLRLGLRPMDISKEVVNRSTKPADGETEALFQYYSDRLAAAAVTQTFHYMIEGGLEYSYLTTGEAIIFLKIDWTNPTTLYYHLAEPGPEVEAHPDNFRYFTAVGQVLAFALQALGSPVHGQGERYRATVNLNTWTEDCDAILRAIPVSQRKDTPPPSAFEPPRRTKMSTGRLTYFVRGTGLQVQTLTVEELAALMRLHLRSSQTTKHRCQRPRFGRGTAATWPDGREETATKVHRHAIVAVAVVAEAVKMAIPDIIQWTMRPGPAFFATSSGGRWMMLEDLEHKAAVYKRLQALQGVRFVPVFLGAASLSDLGRVYYYDFRVRIVHMMFHPWAGDGLDMAGRSSTPGGVAHGDVRTENALWNDETLRVMLTDFERSVLADPPRPALAQVVPNKKSLRALAWPVEQTDTGESVGRLGSKNGPNPHPLMQDDISAVKMVQFWLRQ